MISDKAEIHPNAKLAADVTVGPWSVIGPDVEIGEGTWVGPHVVIEGPTVIGKNNKIFQFSSIGDEPQDVTYKGEKTRLEIGDGNIIREYCMVSRGTVSGGGVTRLGNDNILMAHAHVGHDCMLGNKIIMVNSSALAGHVELDDYVTIGAYAAVHQFCHVGAYAFITKATYINKDVVPYVTIAGYNPAACGLNKVGLRRNGFSSAEIVALQKAYKIIFRKGLTVQDALAELELMQNENPVVLPFIDALNQSSRGIVR